MKIKSSLLQRTKIKLIFNFDTSTKKLLQPGDDMWEIWIFKKIVFARDVSSNKIKEFKDVADAKQWLDDAKFQKPQRVDEYDFRNFIKDTKGFI